MLVIMSYKACYDVNCSAIYNCIGSWNRTMFRNNIDIGKMVVEPSSAERSVQFCFYVLQINVMSFKLIS